VIKPISYNIIDYFNTYSCKGKKVKQFHYRSREALRVPVG
jgi:hypothetical protein